MPWLKTGDTAAVHPIVLRAGNGADDPFLLQSAIFGFVMRCAIHSACYLTDYFIDETVLVLFGGPHAKEWGEIARKAGYWTRHRRNGDRGWLLVDDPEFLHIRLKAEIEWERQQAADSSNPALTVPVRLRDGDGCRYCSHIVSWNARRGNRAGTYDHRTPGQAATIDTLVVACKACNSARRDRLDADTSHPLKPAPADPHYSQQTLEFLAKHGHPLASREPSDPAPSRTPRTATPPPAGHRDHRDPVTDRTPPPVLPHPRESTVDSVGSADPVTRKAGSTGSGRDGHAVHLPRTRSRGKRGRPRTRGDT